MSKDSRRTWESSFKTGTGYAKVFIEGVQSVITENDLDALVYFLKLGVLKQIEKYQSIDKSDLDEIAAIFLGLMEIDEKPNRSIHDYFETFFETHFKDIKNSKEEDESDSIKTKWKRVLDWVVAETTKDSSLMIKWVDCTNSSSSEAQDSLNSSSSEACADPSSKWELLDLKLIDLDTKLCTKIPEYWKINLKYFKDYAAMVLGPPNPIY